MASQRNWSESGEFDSVPKGFYDHLIKASIGYLWHFDKSTRKITCRKCRTWSVHAYDDNAKECSDHLKEIHGYSCNDITTESRSSTGCTDDSVGLGLLESDAAGPINHGVRNGRQDSSPSTVPKQVNDPQSLDQCPCQNINPSENSSCTCSNTSVEMSKTAALKMRLNLRAEGDDSSSPTPPNSVAEVPSHGAHGGAVGGTDAQGIRGGAVGVTDSPGGRSGAVGGIGATTARDSAAASIPLPATNLNTERLRLDTFQNPNSNSVRALAAIGFYQPDPDSPSEIRCWFCDGGMGGYYQTTIPPYRICRSAHQIQCLVKSSVDNDTSLRALFPGGGL